MLGALSFGPASTAFGQFQWSSYDTSGNLVTANVATGGDLASASSVTFTIPANTQLSFVTKSFTPFSLAGSSSKMAVTFQVSASGGLTGVTSGVRVMGWGCYNSAGTAGFTDDVGYFGMLNAGNYTEPYYHSSGTANLFTGTKPGQGTTSTGFPVNNVTYTNQLQLNMNSSATGISLGVGGSSLANAGVAIVGPSVTQYCYINPVTPLVGGVSTFDEFAFMFTNTTASAVTVTLSGISLGNSLTWDASGANPAAPTDGSGNWGATAANWSSGTRDTIWSSNYSATIGANNGAAGTINITNAAGVTVSNITFNAAGSGSYSITNSTLILTGTPTITVAAGVFATNSSTLGGTGFTKAGNGMFVLLPSIAATNVGATIVNAGTLYLAATAINSLNDDLVVNTGGSALFAASTGIPTVNKLFVNGGGVTNLSVTASTVNQNVVALDNNGYIAASAISQLNVTNFDFRSGTEAFPKFPGTMITNFSVKSTPGTVDLQTRANSSGANGIAGLKINAGTFICDYPSSPPNGDSQGGAKYISTAQMTLAGGKVFQNFNANANRTEAVGGVLINPGATSLVVTNNGPSANNYTLTENAITRNVGGTVDYAVGGTSTGTKATTTSTANVNGILGGYATYAGSDWAVGTTIAPLASASYQASTDPTTWGSTSNVTLNASTLSSVGDGTNINSLKLTAAATVTLNGTLTLSSGGLLVTGSGATAITGGTLKGASGADLIVHQYASADLTISSTLADNTSASSLTKSGTGRLIISGTDNMTGTNYLNGGTVQVGGLAELAAGPVVLNNGTLRYTGSGETSTRSMILNGVGGTIDVAGTATITQTTPIVGGGGFNSPLTPGLNLGDWGGLTKIGSGTLVLAANNVYNGPTVVSNGVLSVSGTNSLTGTSGLTNYLGGGTFTVYGGALGGTGLISGPVDIKNGGTIAPGNGIGTLTLATNLTLETGSTNLFELTNGAAGDLVVVKGNLVIQTNSIIAISVLGSALEPSTNTLITYAGAKSGSFNPNPSVVIVGGSIDGSVTIDESTPGQIKLVVAPQVVITSQPADTIVSVGQNATFNVTATGTAPLSYQWYEYTDIGGDSPALETGATNSSFTITNAQSSDSGYYGVVITNNYNSVTSRVATLLVGNVVPLLSGPTNTTVIAGNNVTFSTTVIIANPTPALQWQTNGVNVAGATSSSLTLNSVPSAYSGMSVSVIATNLAGSVTNSATLTVIVTPVITPQPTNLTVNVGDTAVFTSGATGVPTPALQWYKNGVAIGGQTSGTLTISGAQGSDIGMYSLLASNIAGVATSSIVKLTVLSTSLTTTALAPTNGATGVCYDTPLYVTFNGPISIVNSGKIRIYDSTNSATPVDTIDMSSNTVVVSPSINLTNNIQPHSLFSGDSQVINYFPVIISGNTAAIYPHSGVMTSNQTYYVTMDNGIVADSAGAYFAGISDTNAWRFTTKPTGPANPTNLVVAIDGSGDFVTVQGAVDSIPVNNTNYTLVNIRNGNYVEIVDIYGKNNITFRGQSRAGTFVGYPNNNNLTGTTAGRMAIKVNSSDIKFENMTLTNGTPQGGSQAETLMIYNSGYRCVVNNCDIVSRQDTILINAAGSQGYFYNCKIVGNFDYVWGVGVGFFTNCVLHTITNSLSGSYNVTAARTGTAGSLSANTPWVNPSGTLFSSNGLSFVSCTLEADPGVTGITLADANGTPGGVDSWVYSFIDTNAYVSPLLTLSNQYVFWQYSNKDITGTYPISFTNVQTIGVTNNDPRLLAATNAVTWLYGWLPQLAPNILTQPTNQTANVSNNVSFAVVATGISSPTYQWFKGASLISGATSATFTITNVQFTDAASYSVVVSNAAGVVTSSNATLTVPDRSPVANTASYTRPAGQPLNILIANLATNWSDPDGDIVALSGGISSTNGVSVPYDSTYIYYTNANDVNDQIDYTVADGRGGTAPGLINIVIGPPPTNSVTSTVVNVNGSVTLSFLGAPNYIYQVQATTNLTPPVVWTPVSTNTADGGGLWQFTDTTATNYTQRFYRSVYGP
jgi:autotransporter-associated beta strand protein